MKFSNKNKKENQQLRALLNHRYGKHILWEVLCIPEGNGKTPDYFVKNKGELVEIKEIHDAVDVGRSAQWGKIINKLQKAVDKNNKLSNVKGTFLIETPFEFRTPTDKPFFTKAAVDIIKAVLWNKKKIVVGSVNFKVIKVSKKGSSIVFGSHGTGGSFDAASTIHKNIKAKVKTANKQLGYKTGKIDPKKKILLLVNKYPLLTFDWDIYRALSYLYEDLLAYKNIDEIWFQQKTKDGYIHELLYRKAFFQQFETGLLKKYNADDLRLLASWFSSLEKLGDEKKEKLLSVLKALCKDKKPNKLFNNPQSREEMVRLGIWLAENNRLTETQNLVEWFIDDPDPVNPLEYTGKPEFNYHEQIKKGEDTLIITSVLGHLAWVINKLSLRKNYIVRALNYTIKLSKHPNYYIRLQALIPLVDIARRRQWLEELDLKKKSKNYKKFHDLCFGLLRKHAKYPAFAKSLARVFYYYQDLTTEEALEVLNELKHVSESAPLFIYFALFRERHYKKTNGLDKKGFKPKNLKKKLKSIIRDKKESLDLKGTIAWNFWKLLNEESKEFKTVKSYIDLFLELPYEKVYCNNIFRIIEDWIDRKPDICIVWFIEIIKKVMVEVKTEDQARDFWLPVKSAKVLNKLASQKPKQLAPVVKKLVKLWKLGAYIGSPKEVFNSYKQVTNAVLRKKVKSNFKIWYREMQKMNPKVEKVKWD